MSLHIGSIAPDFTQESTEGAIHFHEWIGNHWAVLFSHPKDFTPVCTTELGTVAKLKGEFDKRGVKAIGVSVDDLASHQRWTKDINESQGTHLNFPLLGDADRKVATLYDMIHPEANDTLTVRSVFVIDPQKKIRLTLTYPAPIGRRSRRCRWSGPRESASRKRPGRRWLQLAERLQVLRSPRRGQLERTWQRGHRSAPPRGRRGVGTSTHCQRWSRARMPIKPSWVSEAGEQRAHQGGEPKQRVVEDQSEAEQHAREAQPALVEDCERQAESTCERPHQPGDREHDTAEDEILEVPRGRGDFTSCSTAVKPEPPPKRACSTSRVRKKSSWKRTTQLASKPVLKPAKTPSTAATAVTRVCSVGNFRESDARAILGAPSWADLARVRCSLSAS